MTAPIVPLGEICQFVGGGTPSRKNPQYWNGAIPWATVKDFSSNVIWATEECISQDGLHNSASRVVPAGTVLLVTRVGLGKVAIAGVDLAINQDIKAIIPSDEIMPEHLFWLLKYLSPQIEGKGTGATVKGVTLQDVKSLEVSLPPLDEQRRTVGLLNGAAQIERLRAQARERFKELIPALFIKMFGDPVENPMGWETVRLSEIVSEFRYGTSKKGHDGTADGSLPVLRIPNVVSGAINLDGLKHTILDAKELQRLKLAKGDLLFVRTNGNPQYIGRCSTFDLDLDAAFASYLIRARLIDRSPLSPYVVGDAMGLPSLRSVLLSLARTTAGNYNINIGGLGSIELPVPPTEKQEQYLSLVTMLKARMRLQLQAAELAGTLSSSLMGHLLGVDE